MKTVKVEDDLHQRLAIEARHQGLSIQELAHEAITFSVMLSEQARKKAGKS